MHRTKSHLRRYKEIAALLWKYARADLSDERAPASNGSATPEQLSSDLEAMGPTFVKIGQVLAGRSDLLPPAYVGALARLQDRVQPFPWEDVERTVQTELRARISKAFGSFSRKPLAAASLGQVHAATLRDGTPVVVKVQRPGIREQVAEDFVVLGRIAAVLDRRTAVGRKMRFSRILEEFRTTIERELDYELEAHNLETVGDNLREFERIRIPRPIRDYVSPSVLTMEHVRGHKITALSPVARLEGSEASLAEELFRAYLKQILVDGLFHADPHPGNVFLTEDGKLALLDLGMVGHLAPGLQERLLELLLAVTDRKGEEAAEVVLQIGEKTEAFDLATFRNQVAKLVATNQNRSLETLSVGASVLDMGRCARDNGLFVPEELTLLGKTLLQLDEIGRLLDPAFDPNAAVRRNLDELMSMRMRGGSKKGSLFASAIEWKTLVGNLPRQLHRAMDAVTAGGLEIKVRAPDAPSLIAGLAKIANRIAAGVVLASLIVGAALLMRVPTHFQLFGYPGLAMLCFLAAAGGGVCLLVSIFLQDRRTHDRAG